MPRLARPSDYPIEWRHDDAGDLEVTVTLPRLRPHPEWRSETHGDDIVLVVDPDVDIDEITVTYTATAHGYGKTWRSVDRAGGQDRNAGRAHRRDGGDEGGLVALYR